MDTLYLHSFFNKSVQLKQTRALSFVDIQHRMLFQGHSFKIHQERRDRRPLQLY